ncbi:O-antigen ligase [Polynucleobacter sp. MWH-HuK1]|uniref:O-antigen ligase family protein n=1 Tax=Polynucleobacter sp. MWH-HuK1 TaxID=1743158 RepID=UPI001C0D1380|nr:O-antigen ligase family protein [Polynucleobacter sp. MWH-HuK1]
MATFIYKDIVNIIYIQLKWLALPICYALAFILVSYWGIDFQESIKYQVLYLPIVTIDFIVAFIIGYKFNQAVVAKYILIAGALSIFYLLIDAYLHPSLPRIGVLDLDVAMIVPLATISGATTLAFAAIFTLLASTKKTITVAAIFSLGAAFLFKARNSRGHRNAALERRNSVASIWIRRIVGVIAIFFVMALFAEKIQTTYKRLSDPQGDEDPSRTAISTLSFELLSENFPAGIGLGGFSSISQELINYRILDARGEIVYGANLHSSYMTWALEGGLPIVVIVLSLCFFTFRAIRHLLKDEKSRVLGEVMLIWLFQGMLYGLFQQWHNSAPFWMLFGLVFGCYERSKRVK